MQVIDYTILIALRGEGATNMANAMTVHGLWESAGFQCQERTVYLHIREMTRHGYIDEGLRDGKFHTHYITKSGLKKLEEIEQ